MKAARIVPDGSRAVSIGEDNRLKVWDLTKLETLATYVAEGPQDLCSITPNGMHIVATTKSGNVQIFKLENVAACMPPLLQRPAEGTSRSANGSPSHHMSNQAKNVDASGGFIEIDRPGRGLKSLMVETQGSKSQQP